MSPTKTNHPTPSEVESALGRHEGIARAAVVAARPVPNGAGSPASASAPASADAPDLIAYVVRAAADGQSRDEAAVQEWQEIYDRVYTGGPPREFGEDFTGWNSSYDGRPIDLDEMASWRAATVDRVRELRPRNILEIGVGSGLLLARLAPSCDTYWGTDVSTAAVGELTRQVEAQPALAQRVSLRAQAADVVDGLPRGHFDTIVINSVTMCFPSAAYLTQVIAGAMDLLTPGGALYIGDVRNLDTADLFHTSVALHRRPHGDAALLSAAAAKNRARDEQLLVHPGYFAGLPATVPAVAAVDVRLRRSPFHNEMSRHRYDVVLRKNGSPGTVVDVSGCPSLVWGTDVHDLSGAAGIADRTAATRAPVRIVAIPNARLSGEADALRALGDGDAARASAALAGPDTAAVDPEVLARSLEPVLDVVLTPSPDDPRLFEALLVPRRPDRPALTGTYRTPTPSAETGGPRPMAEIPAAAHRGKRFSDRLHGWLHEQLGDRASSVEIVVLDALDDLPLDDLPRSASPSRKVIAPMPAEIDDTRIPTDETGLRAHNRAIVEQYMTTLGQDRLKRHLLFTEDGIGGLWTTETGEPIVIRGRDRLGEHAVWSLQCFPDWVWTNIEIFDTQDPDRFWVECDGEGKILFPGYPEGHYRNHFIHSFLFENGRIKAQREFMNPARQFQALGIEVPRIKREGIPT